MSRCKTNGCHCHVCYRLSVTCADGLPDFTLTEVEVTDDERANGVHYGPSKNNSLKAVTKSPSCISTNSKHLPSCCRRYAPTSQHVTRPHRHSSTRLRLPF